MPLDIALVPVLKDNYVYLLRDTATGTVAVVDPGEPEPVVAALESRGWTPALILDTHHHADHTAGNAELKRRYGATLVGPRSETARIADMDVLVGEGDTVAVGAESATVHETPGHTRGHVAYHFAAAGALFAGDTLFSLGCGRLFEGTAEQMWATLGKLRTLPDETRLFCGHEYTQHNARFCLTVDPENAALKARAEAVDALRARGEPTIPALLGDEKAASPFLRADSPALQAALGMDGAEPAAVFAEVRRRRDSF